MTKNEKKRTFESDALSGITFRTNPEALEQRDAVRNGKAPRIQKVKISKTRIMDLIERIKQI